MLQPNEKSVINQANIFPNSKLVLPIHQPILQLHYGFVQIITKGDEETTIRYEFSLTFPHRKPSEPLLFQINRITPVLINDKEPDLVIDELAHETGKVFYPMSVQIGEAGKFGEIYNYEEIAERWKTHQQKITAYFTGKEVDKYLSLTNEAIQSKEKLNNIFQQDLFINTFFAPIYKSYSEQCRKVGDFNFPFAGKAKPVKFKVEELLSEFLTDTGAIEIFHSGISTDERSFHELEWNYDEATGEKPPADITYEARYTIDEDSKVIQSVNAIWRFETEQPKTIEIRIFPLRGFVSKKSLIMNDKQTNNKEKGFFKDFWDTLIGRDLKQ